mmetsp:Transcript_32446/g.72888  ORF Transcript_32446/g.72888 Transcript_32446/m.72888 type:complete len:236 (+) Transcript_32446:2024-2731(+)|eukprot:749684-Hanusia_phi.AAC.3
MSIMSVAIFAPSSSGTEPCVCDVLRSVSVCRKEEDCGSAAASMLYRELPPCICSPAPLLSSSCASTRNTDLILLLTVFFAAMLERAVDKLLPIPLVAIWSRPTDMEVATRFPRSPSEPSSCWVSMDLLDRNMLTQLIPDASCTAVANAATSTLFICSLDAAVCSVLRSVSFSEQGTFPPTLAIENVIRMIHSVSPSPTHSCSFASASTASRRREEEEERSVLTLASAEALSLPPA